MQRSHARFGHIRSLPLPSSLSPYSTTFPSITAKIFLRCRQQIHLAEHTVSSITAGLSITTYRIEAVLEAVTARNIRVVFLQARKALAPEQLIVHTRAGALRILADIFLEVELPTEKERRNGSIRDGEVITHSKLCVSRRKQVLDLRDSLEERIWGLSTEEERRVLREELSGECIYEEPHACALDGVFGK